MLLLRGGLLFDTLAGDLVDQAAKHLLPLSRLFLSQVHLALDGLQDIVDACLITVTVIVIVEVSWLVVAQLRHDLQCVGGVQGVLVAPTLLLVVVERLVFF